jgi:GntP family gluconate:H+ symporter
VCPDTRGRNKLRSTGHPHLSVLTMEFYQTAVLVGTVLLVVTLSSHTRLPFFLSLLLGALVFALFARMSLPSIGDAFSLGFAQTIDSFGLFIIAGCIGAIFLERSGVVARIASAGLRRTSIAVPVVGLFASLAPSTSVALALLRPWCLVAAGSDARGRARVVTTLALALAAGQAFIYPSLYAVATRAILKVDLGLMLAIGLGLALATATVGWFFVRWMTARVVGEATPQQAAGASHKQELAAADIGAVVVPVLAPLLLLITATFAQIPSEPLGRDAKDFFVFTARPTVILALSLGLVLLTLRRWDRKILAETGWMGDALSASVRPLLAVGAAGGFISLLQATGMAELVAEHVSTLHIGIAVPFLIALVLKALQGSPLVATLTAAGMIEPLLPGLGLGDAWGHALAAAAIGAGTLIVHINDPAFWLVADMAELTPAQTLALHTLGTLVQAAVAIVLLLILAG